MAPSDTATPATAVAPAAATPLSAPARPLPSLPSAPPTLPGSDEKALPIELVASDTTPLTLPSKPPVDLSMLEKAVDALSLIPDNAPPTDVPMPLKVPTTFAAALFAPLAMFANIEPSAEPLTALPKLPVISLNAPPSCPKESRAIEPTPLSESPTFEKVLPSLVCTSRDTSSTALEKPLRMPSPAPSPESLPASLPACLSLVVISLLALVAPLELPSASSVSMLLPASLPADFAALDSSEDIFCCMPFIEGRMVTYA